MAAMVDNDERKEAGGIVPIPPVPPRYIVLSKICSRH